MTIKPHTIIFNLLSIVYEASGRLVEELIHTGSGNVHHESGLFDECLSVVTDGVDFDGQYCSVFFDLKLVSSVESDVDEESNEGEPYTHMSNFRMPSIGFCLPSTCSARDLRSAVAQLVGFRSINGTNHQVVTISSEDYCYSEDKTKKIKFDFLTTSVLYEIYLETLRSSLFYFQYDCSNLVLGLLIACWV